MDLGLHVEGHRFSSKECLDLYFFSQVAELVLQEDMRVRGGLGKKNGR